jgi:hypothetical protein
MKICKKCKEEKDSSQFRKEPRYRDGLTARCKSCYETKEQRKERYERNRDATLKRLKENYRLNPKISILENAKQRAKAKGVDFAVGIEDFEIPEFCPVLGIEMKISDDRPSQNSPSLDRIVPELGYVKGNIQVISYKANRLKSDASLKELELFANWILNTLIKPKSP